MTDKKEILKQMIESITKAIDGLNNDLYEKDISSEIDCYEYFESTIQSLAKDRSYLISRYRAIGFYEACIEKENDDFQKFLEEGF